MPAQRSPYDILNVSHDAEPVVIEAAYRALMKKYHPDQAAAAAAGGAPSAAEINRAFAILRDADRRADYDRREWTRQQDIQLARYQPAPPPASRGMRVFGWGGWIVALILGGVIAAMAGRLSDATASRAAAARAAAAAAAEPDFRSQPSAPEASLVPAATLAEIRAEALAPGPPPPTAAQQKPAAAPIIYGGATVRAAPRKPRKQSAPPARKGRTAAEEDFLEREGYIY